MMRLNKLKIKIKMEHSVTYQPKTYLHKICVIGDVESGKTSFIKKITRDSFSPDYRSTIGVDFGLKVVPLPHGDTMRLQLWDIAGQERYGNMTGIYYKETSAAYIVCDVTRSSTMDGIIKWKRDIDEKLGCPVILLINKIDLVSELEFYKNFDFAKAYHIDQYFLISSKEGTGLQPAIDAMTNLCLTLPSQDDKQTQVKPAEEELVLCEPIKQKADLSGDVKAHYIDVVTILMTIVQVYEEKDVVLQIKLKLIEFLYTQHDDHIYEELKTSSFMTQLIVIVNDIKLDCHDGLNTILNYLLNYKD